MVALLLAFLLPAPPASTLTGHWITPDKSIVQVFECGQQLCVRIETIAPKDAPRTDVSNPDTTLRSRPLCGLTIGTAFTLDGSDRAKDGKVYDPESGKTYSAQMQGSGDALKLRGYIGVALLGRTETWHRVTAPVPACQ